jgi:hypothetical protein
MMDIRRLMGINLLPLLPRNSIIRRVLENEKETYETAYAETCAGEDFGELLEAEVGDEGDLCWGEGLVEVF